MAITDEFLESFRALCNDYKTQAVGQMIPIPKVRWGQDPNYEEHSLWLQGTLSIITIIPERHSDEEIIRDLSVAAMRHSSTDPWFFFFISSFIGKYYVQNPPSKTLDPPKQDQDNTPPLNLVAELQESLKLTETKAQKDRSLLKSLHEQQLSELQAQTHKLTQDHQKSLEEIARLQACLQTLSIAQGDLKTIQQVKGLLSQLQDAVKTLESPQPLSIAPVPLASSASKPTEPTEPTENIQPPPLPPKPANLLIGLKTQPRPSSSEPSPSTPQISGTKQPVPPPPEPPPPVKIEPPPTKHSASSDSKRIDPKIANLSVFEELRKVIAQKQAKAQQPPSHAETSSNTTTVDAAQDPPQKKNSMK
jgi:hypothetical protein